MKATLAVLVLLFAFPTSADPNDAEGPRYTGRMVPLLAPQQSLVTKRIPWANPALRCHSRCYPDRLTYFEVDGLELRCFCAAARYAVYDVLAPYYLEPVGVRLP